MTEPQKVYCKSIDCMIEYDEAPVECETCCGKEFLTWSQLEDWLWSLRHNVDFLRLKNNFPPRSRQWYSIMGVIENAEEEENEDRIDDYYDDYDDPWEDMRPRSKQVIYNDAGEPLGWEWV